MIARMGVERVARDGEKIAIVLRDGAEAPVSRVNVRALKEAGWF
jgi:DNA-binding LytR/AlgR family response regulator